ncbi:glutaredoxin family protein [Undibacterium baiyunense]|uniref:Glutaredoxin family protein n=1 Tax=Undibacterium baiyunense TaxID=2828731 RepID=A0A941DG94_9BURK|nr:glutaredoxin family protein [Undibacterium baiyunense]MBR7747078.1 glutaredoxin family protein [Undibacterium baiyunense]
MTNPIKYTHFFKQSLAFILTVLLGLMIGYAAIHLKELAKSSYVEGDYSNFYVNAKSQVILYGTATCPFCKEARSYLKSKNISFADYDVNLHEQGQKDFEKLNGEVVPLILIGDRKISGFDLQAIDDALLQLNN